MLITWENCYKARGYKAAAEKFVLSLFNRPADNVQDNGDHTYTVQIGVVTLNVEVSRENSWYIVYAKNEQFHSEEAMVAAVNHAHIEIVDGKYHMHAATAELAAAALAEFKGYRNVKIKVTHADFANVDFDAQGRYAMRTYSAIVSKEHDYYVASYVDMGYADDACRNYTRRSVLHVETADSTNNAKEAPAKICESVGLQDATLIATIDNNDNATKEAQTMTATAQNTQAQVQEARNVQTCPKASKRGILDITEAKLLDTIPLEPAVIALNRKEIEIPKNANNNIIAMYRQPVEVERYGNVSRINPNIECATGYARFDSPLATVFSSPYIIERTTYEIFPAVNPEATPKVAARVLEENHKYVKASTLKQNNFNVNMLKAAYKALYTDADEAKQKRAAQRIMEAIDSLVNYLNALGLRFVDGSKLTKEEEAIKDEALKAAKWLFGELSRLAGFPYGFDCRLKHLKQIYAIANAITTNSSAREAVKAANATDDDTTQKEHITDALGKAGAVVSVTKASVKRAVTVVLGSMVNGVSLYANADAIKALEGVKFDMTALQDAVDKMTKEAEAKKSQNNKGGKKSRKGSKSNK